MLNRRTRLLAVCALAGLAIFLGLGMALIFRTQLATGQMYPAYSSFQSDPSGTALLFQALNATGKFQSVTRAFQPPRDSGIQNATILFLGCQLDSDAQLKEWELTAQQQNRVVIAAASDKAFSGRMPNLLKQQWRIQIARSPIPYFSMAEGWTVMSAIDHRPVIIERLFGSGTVVFSLASSLFTNRSMVDNKDDELIARLIGSKPRVVFDETHLGIVNRGTVLGLARRYHLSGLLWGLLILALTFIWNQAIGFPPRPETQSAAIAGRTARSGLVQLLRGQILASNLIATCVSEWNRVHPKSKLENIPNGDPVESYHAIQDQLTSKPAST